MLQQRDQGQNARLGAALCDNRHAGIHAGLEPEAGVFDFNLHRSGSRFRIEDGRFADDLARKSLLGKRVDLNLDGLAGADSRVKVLHLSRNFGHQSALLAGLRHASGDAVIVMEDGRCREMGDPRILARDRNSLFHNFIQFSGEAELLFRKLGN